MEYELFAEIVNDYKCKNPILFGLEPDRIPRVEEVEEFEKILSVELSLKYKKFLLSFGGGYFGFANIYSLDKESDFYLLNYNDIPVEKYLRISDNGCGDYYMLQIDNQKCLEQLFFYDHETNSISITEYSDIFEYLAYVGLKHN
ncbi:MAG: SMI1/KNR4 family protein [Clostridia bacterium]|nr:SMI1/KNR4 family protein [Clostridia bacterium]MEE1124698.1 SMI1/KNR4 family protein [Acutalibacteraceae bacterium]